MATVCLPSQALPSHEVSQEELIAYSQQRIGHLRITPFFHRILRNSKIQKRYWVRSMEETADFADVATRNQCYMDEAKRLGEEAVQQALVNANVAASEIDCFIVTSCTGFMIPSLDAYLMQKMGFRKDVRRLPISQLGCAAGNAALGQAYQYCKAFPEANVLVLAVEFGSLSYQPDVQDRHAWVANALFGDGVGACVVRGQGGHGFQIEESASYLIPGTTHYMGMTLNQEGFHIQLDAELTKDLDNTIFPVIHEFLEQANLQHPDFYVLHPGGAKLLEQISQHLGVSEETFVASWESLSEVGNLSSASILGVLKNTFERHTPESGQRGVMFAFGPGFSVECNAGVWV